MGEADLFLLCPDYRTLIRTCSCLSARSSLVGVDREVPILPRPACLSLHGDKPSGHSDDATRRDKRPLMLHSSGSTTSSTAQLCDSSPGYLTSLCLYGFNRKRRPRDTTTPGVNSEDQESKLQKALRTNPGTEQVHKKNTWYYHNYPNTCCLYSVCEQLLESARIFSLGRLGGSVG